MLKKLFHNLINSPAKTLRAFCLIFIVAVAGATTINLSLVSERLMLFELLVGCTTVAGIFWQNKKVRFIFLMLCAIALGTWRVASATADCLKISKICTGKATVQNAVKPNSSGPTKLIQDFAKEVGNRIKLLWPGPTGALMAGLLYGEQSSLPKNIKDNFSRAGLSHIVAVSGFNVTVVASSLIGLTMALGMKRNRGSSLALAGIWLFVIFSGGTASAVRAGLMATVVIVAERLGRMSTAGPALLFAATIMVAVNPFTLLYNIGFQLSAIATAGLIYGSPIIASWFEKITFFKNNDWLAETIATTLAATISTLPIILFYFGRVSPLGLLANILAVPYLPLLMLCGFITLVASIIFAPLAHFCALITGYGLNYLLSIAYIFGNPKFSLTIFPSLTIMILWYILLIFYVLKEKNRRARLENRV